MHLSSLRESKNGSYFLFLKEEKPSGFPEGFVQTVSSVSLAVQGFFESGSTLLSFRFLTVGSVPPDFPPQKN
jgi:hypothetical protein